MTPKKGLRDLLSPCDNIVKSFWVKFTCILKPTTSFYYSTCIGCILLHFG